MDKRRGVLKSVFLVLFFLSFIVPSSGLAATMKDLLFDDIQLNRESKILIEALEDLKKGDYDAAITNAQKAIEEKPDLAPAFEILGAALVMKGNISDGLDTLKKAIQMDPKQSSAYTKIGDVYLAQNHSEKAETYFNKAIDIHPRDRQAHQRLGLLYDRKGDAAKAILHYEAGLVGTPPDYVGIKVDLCRLYNAQRAFSKTVKMLEGLITEKYQGPVAHIVLGTAYLGRKQPEKALNHFQIVRKLEPDSERAYLSLGIAYRDLKEYEKSVKALKKVIQKRPEWSTGYFQLGETYLAMKNYNKALANLKKAETFSPNPLNIQKRVAELYLAQKKPDQAIAVYKKIINEGKSNIHIYDLLGTTYQLSNRLEEAEKTFITLKETHPDTLFGYYRLGLFYGYVKKYNKAVAELKAGLAKYPNNPDLLKALSVTCNRKGDQTQAVFYAEKLLQQRPDNLADKIYLGGLLMDTGELKRSETLYREILSKDEQNVLALNNLANILAQSDRLDIAAHYARQAAELAPNNGMVIDTLGWILHQRGENEKALKIMQKALEIMPDNPVFLYHQGVIYHVLGKTAQAKKSLEKALEISEQFKGAQKARQLLTTL